MISILKNIPDLKKHSLPYVFENLNLKQKENTLWLEFGVFSGKTINFISSFTEGKVFGFDSFEGLPEDWRPGFPKELFDKKGILPKVNNNVELIKGWFNETLPDFVKEHCINNKKKISFIHIDCDIYSSTKYIFDILKDYLDENCVIVFDELLNYKGFDGDNGELRALYEFINENNVKWNWIGMNGDLGLNKHENAVIIIHKIN